MKVKVDVAGMYFDIVVDVDDNATIEQVMRQAVEDSKKNQTRGRLYFGSEPFSLKGQRQINWIAVDHQGGTAKSRQNGGDTGRPAYKDGLYFYQDDMVTLAGPGFAPSDPNEKLVHAWQYYVYSSQGVDKARAPGVVGRKVQPFSEYIPGLLEDGGTVVWRLVGIFLAPPLCDLTELPDYVTIALARA